MPPFLRNSIEDFSASQESRGSKQASDFDDDASVGSDAAATATPGIEVEGDYDEDFTPISNSFEDNIDTLLGVLVQSTTTSTTTARPPTTPFPSLLPFFGSTRRPRPSRPPRTQSPRRPKQNDDGRPTLSPQDEDLLNEILRELHQNPRFANPELEGPGPTLDPRDQGLLNEILREMGQAQRFRFGQTTTTTTRRPPTLLPSLIPFFTRTRRPQNNRPQLPRQPRLTNDDIELINKILMDLRESKNENRPASQQTTRAPQRAQPLLITSNFNEQQQEATTQIPIMILTPQPPTMRPSPQPRPRGAKLIGLKIKNFLNSVKKRIPLFG